MDEKLAVVPSVAIDELIVVKQLPIIEDRLDEAYESMKARLAVVSQLVVTEENYKELKKTRADLNKEFDALETLRKKVRDAVEAPYKKFEKGAYKRFADEYKKATAQLDGNIKDVEAELKERKQRDLLAYYDEYRQSLGLDKVLADPRRSGIKVGLSDSMKSLKEQAKGFLDRIDGDLKMIDTLDDKDEVLAEYRVLLNVTEAVRIVADRHKRIEEERVRREAEEAARREREEREAAVAAAIAEAERKAAEEAQSNMEPVASAPDNEVLTAPTESVAVEEEETEKADAPIYHASFRVYGTIDMLKALKQFFVQGGYKFETLKEDK